MDMGAAYPNMNKDSFIGSTRFRKSTAEQRQILSKINRGEFNDLDEFYESLKLLLKPVLRVRL